ncbi:MAG: hypothetical protein Q9201_007565 [Fulgogasparrea decipioides]
MVSLPKETVKSYLPRLWQLHGELASVDGFVDLEPFVAVRNEKTRIALEVILNALEDSEAGHGVATELKMQLDDAQNRYAEPMMSRIFKAVADLLRQFGRHQEMAYAMSEWFTVHAAEEYIPPEIMFRYIVALDRLRADMTAPLHSFLRRVCLSSADLRNPSTRRSLRPKTLKKLRTLWKDHRKTPQPARYAQGRLIAGGDLDLEEVVQRYHHDPDSILVDPSPTKRLRRTHNDFDDEDVYSRLSDAFDDHDICGCGQRQLEHYRFSETCPRHGRRRRDLDTFEHQALLAPPRMRSPLLLEHDRPLHYLGRPCLARNVTQ